MQPKEKRTGSSTPLLEGGASKTEEGLSSAPEGPAKEGDRQVICVLLGAQREADEKKTWLCTYYANFEETSALLNTVLG